MSWIIPALISGFAVALFSLVNEYMQVRSLHLLFWMRLISTIFLIPWILTVSWPEKWQFYILMLINAPIIAYSDIVIIGLTAADGAGITSRIRPLIHALIFLIWLVITPSLIVDYFQNPLRSLGIIASLAMGISFALRLKKCSVSIIALKTAFPALIFGAVAVVIGRLAMEYTDQGIAAIYQYVLLQCIMVFFCYCLFQFVSSISVIMPHMGMVSGISDIKVILAGLLAACSWMISVPAKWYAIMQVENPAYVTIFGLSAPVWVLLVYSISGKKEDADVISGFGIVASVAALAFFTYF